MVFIQREIGLTFGSGARLITGTATSDFNFYKEVATRRTAHAAKNRETRCSALTHRRWC